MPKQKTHSGASKRFRAKKSGLVKRARSGKNHILAKKSTKRKRGLRQGTYVDSTQAATIRNLIPYQK
ncbi:MAG: 50S ribosomal protein L35 [Clostridiales bacterium]|jgi:large subunit ribosomal protein L35|nr:50S ribosomal protein L35 [Clostridiales bacterium]